MGFSLDEYVDVAERIRIFRSKYPAGSLQPLDLSRPLWVETIDGKSFVCYAAAAYRHPFDRRPGIGIAWEPFPGPTQFTKDSEAMNAETAAWGRAIVAALAADTQKVASAQEVRNRRADSANAPDAAGSDRGARPAPGRPATDKQRKMINLLVDQTGIVPETWPLADDLTMRDASALIDRLQAEEKMAKGDERKSTMRDEVVPDPVANAIQDKLEEFSEAPF